MKERLDKYLTDLGYFDTKAKLLLQFLQDTLNLIMNTLRKQAFKLIRQKNMTFRLKQCLMFQEAVLS